MRKLLASILLLWASISYAADNQVTITTGSGVTMRTTDVGAGVQSSNVILSSTSGGGTAIYGTAGTANANVITVQGIASGTAVPVSVSSSTGLAQDSTTSGQTGSIIMGSGQSSAHTCSNGTTCYLSLTTAGDLRTVFSNTTIAVTNTGTFAVQAAQSTASNLNATVVGTGTFAVQAASTQSGTWTVQPGNTANTTSWLVKTNDGTNTQILDPCQSATKLYQPISQTTSTQLFAGTSAKKTYVCHIFVLANSAETVTLVSGTGSVCATSPHAMIGPSSVTALSAIAANGGFSLGMGGFAIAASTTNADNVCLVQVGSAQLTGVISYVAQ